METEVRFRVEEGCKVLEALKGVMRCRTFGMETKICLCEGLAVPFVLHGADTGE